MDILIILSESLSFCVLYTVLMLVNNIFVKRSPSLASLDYSQDIVNRLYIINHTSEIRRKSFLARAVKKLPCFILFLIIFSLVFHYINGCESFLEGFTAAIVFSLIWIIYDTFIIDMVLFRTRLFKLKGTEDMVSSYHNYKFYFSQALSFLGMCLAGSLVIGLIVTLI